MYAREYIRNDDIGVLFKQHGFSLDYNYETKSFEQKKNSNREELQPAQRGKAISTSATKRKTQATAADKHPSGPSRAVLFEISTEQQLCLPPTTTNNEPQPGPSGETDPFERPIYKGSSDFNQSRSNNDIWTAGRELLYHLRPSTTR